MVIGLQHVHLKWQNLCCFEYGKIIDKDTAFKMGQSDYDDDCIVGAD